MTSKALMLDRPAMKDATNGGPYRLSGTVYEYSTLDKAVAPVFLLDRRSGLIVRKVFCDPITGAYEILNIRKGPWILVSPDPSEVNNAAALDNMLAAP